MSTPKDKIEKIRSIVACDSNEEIIMNLKEDGVIEELLGYIYDTDMITDNVNIFGVELYNATYLIVGECALIALGMINDEKIRDKAIEILKNRKSDPSGEEISIYNRAIELLSKYPTAEVLKELEEVKSANETYLQYSLDNAIGEITEAIG